tara:strand:+ start:203 stop:433 length:231 start_codon:yes stop_codon:yes gene_type:complete
MPTYSYKCERCNKIVSVFQGINDKPLINCDTCNSNISRIITGGTGMIFKGSGFYQTDYNKQKKTIDDQNNISDKEK